jgi:patatin-like phospholipase/acyl hydrolase
MSEMIDHPVQKRLSALGPKRILALDGGGIRGAITLGFLVQLEKHLRKRHDNPNLLLRDYFDLIGGTSTGSIIAASLAIGMNTTDILTEYEKMGDQILNIQQNSGKYPNGYAKTFSTATNLPSSNRSFKNFTPTNRRDVSLPWVTIA